MMILDSGLLFFGPPCISVLQLTSTNKATVQQRKYYFLLNFCYFNYNSGNFYRLI